MNHLKLRYDSLVADYNQKKGQADFLKSQIEVLTKELSVLESSSALEFKTLDLLNLSSAASWESSKVVIETLVTRALKAIFHDRDYSFVVERTIERAVPAVSFSVVESGMSLDLADEVGGGIVDVVSLVLRIAFLSLYKPKMRQFLVLDEPCKHLSVVYVPAMAKFIKQLSHELKITILITTHSRELCREADTIFKAKSIDGVCVIEKEPMPELVGEAL